MRVLHIIHNLDRAGAQRSLASLLDGFAAHEGTHMVAPWKRSGPVADEISAEFAGPWGDGLSALRGLGRLAARFKPDVIHAHMDDSALFAAATALPRGIPYFVTFHDGTRLVPDLPQPKKALRVAALRGSCRRAAGIIGVRDALAPMLCKHLGLPAAGVTTVPACVALPTREAVAGAAARRRDAAGPLRILAVGRHISLKRHAELIEAAGELGRRGVAAEVTILGDGPLLAENAALASQLNGPAKVHVAGASSEVTQHLQRADVFVNTSEYEGTSMAILEAMSWGVPVVASLVEGNREIVRAGETGYPYCPGDASDLADQIMAAAAAPSVLTAEARRMVEERFSAPALAGLHLELYRRALGSDAGARPR